LNKSLLNLSFTSSLIVYLTFTLVVMGAFPADLYAMFLPSSPIESADRDASSSSREKNIQNIQKTLESKILQQRLKDLGLSPEQISSRVSQLTDDQLHRISSRIDAIQTGGGDDPLGFVIALLVIAILVVVLLQLSGHKIIITR
jgi:hypothetical protein